MKADGAVARWLATARAGCCPCGKTLPAGNKRLCRKQRCRKEYLRLYAQDRTISTLRTVAKMEPAKDKPMHVNVELECGHRQVVPRSKADRSKRRHCRECTGGAPSASRAE